MKAHRKQRSLIAPQGAVASRAQPTNRTSVRGQSGLPNQALQRLLASGTVQPKLRITTPGDASESEADLLADQIMRMPAPGLTGGQMTNAQPMAQRKCAACERDERLLQRKASDPGPLPNEESLREINANAQVDPVPGEGSPLSAAERAFFEPRVGRDLGQVRLHSGPLAAQIAESMQARAFTYGHHIVFGPGELAPARQEGRWLLAHELAHVLQQVGFARSTESGTSGIGWPVHRSPQPYVARVVCPGRSRDNCVGPCTDANGRRSRCRWSGTIRYGCQCPSVSPEPGPVGFSELLLIILILILTRGSGGMLRPSPVTPGVTPPMTPGMPPGQDPWTASIRRGQAGHTTGRALAAAGGGERELIMTPAGTRAMVPVGVGAALAAEPQSYFAFLDLLDQAEAGVDLRSELTTALDLADPAALLRLMDALEQVPDASLRSLVASRVGAAPEGRATV